MKPKREFRKGKEGQKCLERIYIVADGGEGEDGHGEEVACHILVAKEDLAEDAETVFQATAEIPPGRTRKDEEQSQTKHLAF